MKPFKIVDTEIDTSSLQAFVLDESKGAVVTFTGHVREWTQGTRTVHLEYEAYVSMAEKKLAQIGEEINQQWPGVKIAIAHRVGKLDISEVAVAIVTAAAHRKECYASNEYAIERIKEIVPIWKKEVWDDGEEWIGDTKQYHKNVEVKR